MKGSTFAGLVFLTPFVATIAIGSIIEYIKHIKSKHMKNIELINLTPHALNLHGEGGVVNVPPSGQVARLSVTRQELEPVAVGGIILPVARPTLGEIVGLPPAYDGRIYVVSALVAEAAKRPDVLSPGELVRDKDGVIVGARGLSVY